MEDFVYDHFLAIFGAKKMAEKYLHGFIVGVRALAEEEATRCTVFGAPPHVFTRSCSPMHQRLQPCAPEAAAPCTRGSNPVHQRLQPCAPEAAAPCTRSCKPHATGALLRVLEGAAAMEAEEVALCCALYAALQHAAFSSSAREAACLEQAD
jgi:hypothetical protein